MNEFFEIMNTDLCEVQEWMVFEADMPQETEDEYTAWIEHMEEEFAKDLEVA